MSTFRRCRRRNCNRSRRRSRSPTPPGVAISNTSSARRCATNPSAIWTQSAQNLPSTLLAWHYRSRYESLISFSNAAFYSGNLFTIPDRQRAMNDQTEIRVTAVDQGAANVDALLARSISFHFMENGVYEDRTNPNE